MATKKVTKRGSKKETPAKKARSPKKAAPRKSAVRGPKKATPTKKIAARRPKKRAVSAKRTPAKRPAKKKAASSKLPAKKKKSAPVAAAGTRAKTSKPARKAPSKKARRAPVRREDRPGHLDPKYAAELRAQAGVDEDQGSHAFLDGPESPNDDLAEERGEEVVEKATTGEDAGEESLDQVVPEEQGGPFVETSGNQEFAEGADSSNPKDAFREPFPTT